MTRPTILAKAWEIAHSIAANAGFLINVIIDLGNRSAQRTLRHLSRCWIRKTGSFGFVYP